VEHKFETERLLLRPHTLDDIEPSYQMNLDEKVSRYTGDNGVVSREEIERRIKEDVLGDYEKHGYGRFALELKDTGEFIGFAGLKYLEDLKEVDLGYRLKSIYWGKGFATEAAWACLEFGFEVLDLKRIIAMLLPENNASIRVLEKLGFCFEKETIKDGQKIFIYSLTKEDYFFAKSPSC